MEFSSQYARTSTQTLSPVASPEVSADALSPADMHSVQARIFPEYGFDGRSSSTPQAQTRDASAHPQFVTHPQPASAAGTQDREKRGAALGTCARSAFRECRGGDALQDSASSHIAFDQGERKQTRGDNGRGTCEGIVRETMRRIDRSYSGAGALLDLPSTVSGMNRDMGSTRRADNSNVFANINAYQHSPDSLALVNYRRSTTIDLNPGGRLSVGERVAGLLDQMSDMPRGGLALIHVGVDSPDATGAASSGHAMLVQRLPRDASGDGHASPDRYAIFDPNNGAFTYESQDQMQTALRDYMGKAFNEIGNVVAPDSVLFFTPPTAADWGSLAPTTSVPAPANILPEPEALLRHFQQNYPAAAGPSHPDLKRSPAPEADS